MSDLYIETRLKAIKDIASASCTDEKDADNIADFCDEIYSAIPKLDKVVEELKTLKEDTLAEYNIGEYNLDNNIGNSIAENYRKDMNEGKCFAYDEAIEIVKQEAEKYEECYKDCGDCEAYNKEKHHCPKFCKVITEAVKEIEENHNIKGKWEMTYKGKRKDVNTGLMISAYKCKCSVCGWETGNQGT